MSIEPYPSTDTNLFHAVQRGIGPVVDTILQRVGLTTAPIPIVRAMLRDPTNVANQHISSRDAMAYDIYAATGREPDARLGHTVIDAASWQGTVDPDQPTIGLRASGNALRGSAVLAAANNMLRLHDEQTANIVLLHRQLYSDEGTVKHKRGYYAQNGGIVTLEDTIKVGDFPVTQQLDAVSGVDFVTPKAKRNAIERLNSPAANDLIHDKARFAAAYKPYRPQIERPLVQETFAVGLQVDEQLKTSSDTGRPIVIKPVDGSGGENVIMFDPVTMAVGEAYEQLAKLQPAQRVIIEPWFQSTPIYHPQTKVRQDWNLRTLIIGGQAAGSYARVGKYGAPVNIGNGAAAVSFDTICEQAGMSSMQKTTLQLELERIGRAAFEITGANIIGIDTITDAAGRTVLIEANGELSGGLRNMMTAGKSETDWQPAINIVRGLNQSLFGVKKPRRYHLPANQRLTTPVDGNQIANEARMKFDYEALVRADAYLDRVPTIEPAVRHAFKSQLSFSAAFENTTSDQIAAMQQRKVEQPKMALTLADYYASSGEFEAACQELNYYANSDPTNYIRTLEAASKLQDIARATSEGVLDVLYNRRIESPAQAEAYARTILSSAMGATVAEHTACSLQTLQVLQDTLAERLASNTAGDLLPIIDESRITYDEKRYLIGTRRYINGLRAHATKDQHSLQLILEEAAWDPLTIDQEITQFVLAKTTQELHKGIEPSRSEAANSFMAALVRGDLLLAVQMIGPKMPSKQFMPVVDRYIGLNLDGSKITMNDESRSLLRDQLLGTASSLRRQQPYEAAERLNEYVDAVKHYKRIPLNDIYSKLRQQVEQAIHDIA